VELGQGIHAVCRIATSVATAIPQVKAEAKADLSSLSSMLKARWKGDSTAAAAKPEPLSAGQIRSFKITKLDPDAKKVEVELA